MKSTETNLVLYTAVGTFFWWFDVEGCGRVPLHTCVFYFKVHIQNTLEINERFAPPNRKCEHLPSLIVRLLLPEDRALGGRGGHIQLVFWRLVLVAGIGYTSSSVFAIGQFAAQTNLKRR